MCLTQRCYRCRLAESQTEWVSEGDRGKQNLTFVILRWKRSSWILLHLKLLGLHPSSEGATGHLLLSSSLSLSKKCFYQPGTLRIYSPLWAAEVLDQGGGFTRRKSGEWPNWKVFSSEPWYVKQWWFVWGGPDTASGLELNCYYK